MSGGDILIFSVISETLEQSEHHCIQESLESHVDSCQDTCL